MSTKAGNGIPVSIESLASRISYSIRTLYQVYMKLATVRDNLGMYNGNNIATLTNLATHYVPKS